MLRKTLLFVSVILAADFVLGKTLETLFESSKDLSITRLNYTFDKTSEDILILGSSRALHHFVPAIISEKTNKTVYNCGFEGQGLWFSYLQLLKTTNRYSPDHVILEISPNILTDSQSDLKLNILLPFAEKDTAIASALNKNNISESIKFISKVYPYNSLVFDLLYSKYNFVKDSFNGFVPLYETMSQKNEITTKESAGNEKHLYTIKVEYLNKIIELCSAKAIKLHLVISPVFKSTQEEEAVITELKNYLGRYKTIFLSDFSKLETTYGNGFYFKDNLHLNKNGAVVFSKKVGELLAHS